ncbi:hypothetical protein AB0M58_13195 [Streptomyces bobili]|uniref:hypothetical protein n=1 Tax=Streptomyces bobili TaxID=67280 RepID=UPI00343DB0E1
MTLIDPAALHSLTSGEAASVTYAHSAPHRRAWIREILKHASDKPNHRRYAAALADYWATATPGDKSREPSPLDLGLTGVSWPVECALSTDFSHIHRPPRAEGHYGSEFSHEYITLREKARRRRRSTKQTSASSTDHPLIAALTLNARPITVVEVDLVTRTKGLVTIRGTGKSGTILNDAERYGEPGEGWSAEDGDGKVLATRRHGARNAAIACAREQGISGRISVEIDEEYRRTGARD